MADPTKAAQIVEMAVRRAHGGIVHMNGGGAFNPQGADYDYQTARAYGMGQDGGNWGSVAPASEGERKLHGLPEDSYLMLKGAQHPTWGKAVEAETARGSKIVKHGDRYYSVPNKANGGQVQRFDEGGEVSQSELDRMRFEIAQQQNPTSPVMQATPRSPIQDAIGTFGGYMDKAGKFVSEAIAPTAEKHPVKHFIADLLLAESLKSAGTALQDYTGTARETDEDNPVRGVISKDFRNLNTSTEPLLDPRALDVAGFATPVIKGVKKLANVGAKAITPFASKVDDMVRELSASGAIPQPGLSIKDVTPKALAPANAQGFYSPTEAAALNLQRKTGNGQAFLNDIMKGENVSSEEISGMGLDTFLKDKKNVTAAEVQDYIAQNKLGLGESTYIDPESIYAKSEALNNKIAEVASKYGLRKQQFGSGFVDDKGEFVRDIPDDLRELQRQYVENRHLHAKTAKFGEWQLPGGKNYREVVLTLPQSPEHSEFARLNKKMNDDGLLPDDMQRWTELGSELGAEGRRQAKEGRYRTPHWEDTNPIAHIRLSDRVTDGKKTLLVDEVQSDWHQAARDIRTAEVKRLVETYNVSKEDAQKAVPKDFGYRIPDPVKKNADGTFTVIQNDGTVMNFPATTDIDMLRGSFGADAGVADAPYKEDWYQLALRRAVKEAIDGGYDRVALPTGKRVADRFDLTAYIDRIDYNKNPDGTYRMSAIKDGQEVFAKTRANEKELPDIVGREVAEKIKKNEGRTNNLPVDEFDADDVASQTYQTLSGLDLAVGGEGMKKYYDEIYPSYLKKFGKKYGATVGKTTVDADGVAEPLHYMDITPAMRKEFSTGIHMKKGGAVHFADSLDAMRHELTQRQ